MKFLKLPTFGKPKEKKEHKDTEEQPAAQRLCFVLCDDVRVQTAKLSQELVREFGSSSRIEKEKDGVYFVSAPSCDRAFFSILPIAMAEEEAEKNAEANVFWPQGRQQLDGYNSHVAVGVLSGPESFSQLNIMLTRLARVALRVFNGIAVYWGEGAITNSSSVFMDMSRNMGPDNLPLYLWMRFQVVSPSEGAFELYTRGMAQFGLMDIEVEPCHWQPRELIGFVSNIASYLVNNGAVIKNGDTVGGDEEQMIVVRFGRGKHGGKKPVYRICIADL